MSEFSRRVNVELFKDEPVEFAEFLKENSGVLADIQDRYQVYLNNFQPYWWHAQSPNGEILSNSEHYLHEDGAVNSIEALFGDDTTMYWAPMCGEDRGYRLLRYGKTDRDRQVAQ